MSDTKITFEEEKRDRLTVLLESARQARLSPAEEDEAAQLIRTALAAGRTSIPLALEAMVSLPWAIGVKAVDTAWPDLKATARRYVITGLREQTSDSGKRFRLSLARGLSSADPAAAGKLAVEVSKEMLASEGGMTPRDRQSFANVFIGKGKPWLMHFPIAEWKPADADIVIACAIAACFEGPCPPFTQVWILRWAGEAGRLGKLSEPAVDRIARAVGRWQPRWKSELREAALPDLPEAIANVAQPAPEKAPEAAEEPSPEAEVGEPAERPERPERPERATRGERGERAERGDRAERGERAERSEPGSEHSPRREHVGPPRRQDRRSDGPFDVSQALRQVEAHVNSLRSELHQAQSALRKQGAPSKGRSSRRESTETDEVATPEDTEALRRHNTRLEETVTELRDRLEELAADHEDHAASRSTAEDDTAGQLKTLLSIKLQEDFAVFHALRQEEQDAVVRTHLREVLEHIFDVLQREGISFQA